MRRRVILTAILMVMIVVGAGTGWRWWTVWRFQEGTNDAYVAGDITTVAPKVAGHIVELLAVDNGRVKKGDVLLKLDDREYRAKLLDVMAQIEARKAAITTIENRARWQKAQITTALTEVESADADLKHARQESQRYAALKANEIVSRQRLDQLQADLRKAEAASQRALARVESERAQLPIIQSDLNLARAQLAQAEAQKSLVETDLANTIVTAPRDGIVGNRSAQLGQFARAGAPLLSIVPTTGLWVEANYKETQLTNMRPGQSVVVLIDAFPGQRLTGRVGSFAPASGAKFSLLPPENATGNFTKVVQRVPVRIEFDPGQPLAEMLLPGLSADVTVSTKAVAG